MARGAANEGLRNEALHAALTAALSGRTRALEDLLARHGGYGPRPNLRLAAAFGAEMAALPGVTAPLLEHLAANDAAPDTPQVFLPIAAAHGWVGRLRAGREVGSAWDALAPLAGDERGPVRVGTLDALTSFAATRAGARALLERAGDWLEIDDREIRFGAAAVVIEVFGVRASLAALSNPEPLLAYLSRAIAEVAEAPRAAERSDGRRRLLMALPRTLAAVVAVFDAGDRGPSWLEEECRNARHPDVRQALSNTLIALGDRASGEGGVLAQRLRAALEGSAKPPRDPTRIRPGAGRGRASRPVR
ncbi:MAG TPA: hypothetical protein VHG72_05430 [Polyangia bacterium]|nr:hypothetical protein [Polyangia bacterium]